MIWDSRILMTTIDVVIIAVAAVAVWMLLHSRARLVEPRIKWGETVAVTGLVAIALFYLADLFVMYVLPGLSSRATAMGVMEDLHLNYSWTVILFGVLCMFAGFSLSRRGLFTVIDGLQARDERYRAFVAQSTEGIWRVELERPMPLTVSEDEAIEHFYQNAYVAECNDAFARMFGYSAAAEVIGKRGADFYPRSDPQSAELLRGFRRNGYRLLGRETIRVGADGQARYILINISGIVEDGFLVRAWGTQQDISKRRRAEEAMRATEEVMAKAFRSIYDSITISTLEDGTFVEVNDGFLEISGFTRDEVIGRSAVKMGIWPASEKRTEFIETLSRHGRVRSQEASFRMRDGGYRDFIVSAELIELGGQPHMLAISTDITERKRSEAALQRSRRQLQELSRRLMAVQETERAHVARELHDEIGQALTAVKLNLMRLARSPDETSVAQSVADSMSIVDDAVDEVRNLAIDLRPSLLDDLGLVAALRWYTDRQAERAGLRAAFAADELEPRPPGDIETACFRVAQEAITNVVRHAEARRVDVRLRKIEAGLELSVSDDGVGFDAAAASEGPPQLRMGVVGMEERVVLVGGKFSLESTPGTGTTVRAEFPLEPYQAWAPPS